MALFPFFKRKEPKAQRAPSRSTADGPPKRQTRGSGNGRDEAARKASITDRAEKLLVDHSAEWLK